MLDAVKRYAAGILLGHLILLVAVILVVLWASRQVQTSAREQAQVNEKRSLEKLADQTARGIESQYDSILSNLDVVLRGQPSTSTAPATAASTSATQDASARGLLAGRGGRGGAGGRGGLAGGGRGGFRPRIDLSQPVNVNVETLQTLFRQFDGRVSQIFLVNLNNRRVALSIPDSSQATATATALAGQNIEWLRKLKIADMSAFASSPDMPNGYHLIAVPAVDVGAGLGGTGRNFGGGNPNAPPGSFGEGPGGGGAGGPGGFGQGRGERGPGFQGGDRGGLGGGGGGPGDPGGPGGGPGVGGGMTPSQPPQELVAQFAVVVVVPIEKAREQFLDRLNSQQYPQDQDVSAILVNDHGQVLTSTRLQPGTSLIDQLDASVRPSFKELIGDHTEPVSVVIDTPFTLAGEKTPPLIISSAQLEVPSGRYWTVLIASPISDAEAAVNRLFGTALIGAAFVSLAVAAILASTSFFLIRARVRLERTRHELLTRELQQARHIQLAWLPDLKSVPAGIEVSAANLPASHISGDFYNWFALPSVMQKTGVGSDSSENPSAKIAIVIGDVTGHGMAAAFLMATTQLLVRMNLTRYQDAGRALREVNKQLCMQSGGGFKGQFVTMLVMILDTQQNRIQVASAGHPTPLLEERGIFKPLEVEPQLVLGVNPDEDYHAKTYAVDPGVSVVLYTDGVVEAEAPEGGQYGVERLVKLLQASPDAEPSQRVRAIIDDVKRFGGNTDLHDDVTLVAIRTVPAVVSADA